MLSRPGIRYICVAGCCAVMNNLLLIGLDAAGVGTFGCVVISAAVMIPLAYLLHARWTFDTVAERAGFVRYATIALLNLPASALLILLLRDGMRLPMVVVAPSATIALFCLNFFGARWSIARQDVRSAAPFPRGHS